MQNRLRFIELVSLQFLHQEKKRQDTSLKFHTIGVWEFDVKGFVNMTKVSDKSDQSQYLEIWCEMFQGFWCEHLADLCGTVRLRSADDVAQSRSLRRGVAFPWGTGGLVIGLMRFVLSVEKQLRFHIRQDINVKDGLIIIFISETISLSLCSLSR